MKLLVFYIIVVLIFLTVVSETRISVAEHIKAAEGLSEQSSVTAEYAGVDEEAWFRAYMLMIRRIVPAKVLDLPGDKGMDQEHLFYKILHPSRQSFAGGHLRSITSNNFLQLLSVRHSKGFYIYYLEKLII